MKPISNALAPLCLLLACGIQRDPEAARASVRDADLAFAAATLEGGVDGWMAYMADSSVVVRPHAPLLIGTDSLRAYYTRVFSPGFTLKWRPVRADVSRGGDLAYTIGEWEAVTERAGAAPAVRHGRYVTIWRKDALGQWKVVVDLGNPDSTMTGGGLTGGG